VTGVETHLMVPADLGLINEECNFLTDQVMDTHGDRRGLRKAITNSR
jgi:hypothetical protein